MISYLLEVSICWLGFYLIYALLLSKETFFSANRIYLLGSLLLGLALPLVDYLPTNWFHYEEEGLATVYLQPIHVGVQQIEEMVYVAAEESNNTITNWLIGIYIAGVVFFLSRFLYGFRQIYRLYKNGTKIQKEDHVLVLTETVHYPFSFFNHLFWSEAVAFKSENDDRIISHEKAHIDGKHSIDVLCVELLCVLFWCSPMIYFYKKSIRVIHEYLADALVLETTHKKQYGQLLLRQSQSGLQVALANNFFHSQLKKRIAMMAKNKSTHRSKVKYLLVVPMLLLLITLLTQKDLMAQINESGLKIFSESATENTENNDDEIYQLDVPLSSLTALEFTEEEMEALGIEIKNDTVPTRSQVAIKGDIFHVVEEMPRFPGCEEKGGSKEDISKCAAKEMLMFIYKNIRYPKAAREQGIQGTIVVTFVVDTEGNIVNPEILRSIGGGCDEEVLDLVEQMPKWRPGMQRGQAVNVQFNLPVRYKLEGDGKEEKCEDCPKVTEQINGLKGKTLEKIVVVGYGAEKKSTNKIPNDAKNTKKQKSPSLKFSLHDHDKPEPIIYVNDKLYTDDINTIKPNDIAEIHVLKDKKAIEYAGEKGKNGVILVTMKDKQEKNMPTLYVNGALINSLYQDKINPEHIQTIDVKGKQSGKNHVVTITLKPNAYLLDPKALNYETRKVITDDGSEKTFQIKVDLSKEKYWTRMRTTSKSNQSVDGNIPPPPPPPPSFQDFLEDKKLSKVLILIDGKASTRAELKKRKDDLRMITYAIPNNDKAIEKYGDKAKHGVVRFVTVTKPETFKVVEGATLEILKVGEKSPTGVFKVVEEMPRFPGCDDMTGSVGEKKACADKKMLEFIYKNIKYPEIARKNKVEGMVVVSFIVNEDGTLTDARVLRNIGANTGEEALRVVNLMNEMPEKWTPGKQRGKKVKVQFNLPVRFKLSDEIKKEGTTVKINPAVNFSLQLQEFKAFPNPTEGKLNVSFESSQSPIVVSIMDIAGKEIFRESVNDFDGFYNKNINVSNAAKGTLILNIAQDDKVFSTKILHQ